MVKKNTKNPPQQQPRRPPQQKLTVRRQQRAPQGQLLPTREVRIHYDNDYHVNVAQNDFKTVVQRLTGRQPPTSSSPSTSSATANRAIQGRPTGSLAAGPSNMPSITPSFFHPPSTNTDAQGTCDRRVMADEQPPHQTQPPQPQLLRFREVRIDNKIIRVHEDDYEALCQRLNINPPTDSSPSMSATVDESLNFENANRTIQGPLPGPSNMPSITPDFLYPPRIATYSPLQGVYDTRVMTDQQIDVLNEQIEFYLSLHH